MRTPLLGSGGFSLNHIAVGAAYKVKQRMHGAREVDAVQQGRVHALAGKRQVSKEAVLLFLQGGKGVTSRQS